MNSITTTNATTTTPISSTAGRSLAFVPVSANARRVIRTHRRGGFTLLEMMVATSLLAAFLVLASQLFVATVKVHRASHDMGLHTTHLESFLGSMRADVWAATQIHIIAAPDSDLTTVMLSSPDGHSVRWALSQSSTFAQRMLLERPGDSRHVTVSDRRFDLAQVPTVEHRPWGLELVFEADRIALRQATAPIGGTP